MSYSSLGITLIQSSCAPNIARTNARLENGAHLSVGGMYGQSIDRGRFALGGGDNGKGRKQYGEAEIDADYFGKKAMWAWILN